MRKFIMSVLALSLGLLVLTAAVDPPKEVPSKPKIAYKRVIVRYKVKHLHRYRIRVPTSWHTRRATGYSTEGCDSAGGGGLTSMGTVARFGEVAVLPGDLRLGTRIYFPRAIFGRHYFRVEDHIGYGSTLDIWLHCRHLARWGNPTVTFYTYYWKRKRHWHWHHRTKRVRVVIPA